jgi:hypothetical protein
MLPSCIRSKKKKKIIYKRISHGKGNGLADVWGEADTCDGRAINGQFHQFFTDKQVANGII